MEFVWNPYGTSRGQHRGNTRATRDYLAGRTQSSPDSKKQFDAARRVYYIGAVNGNLNLLLSSALLLSRAAVGL
jgi:thiosulfate reductase cytochrome b subunit